MAWSSALGSGAATESSAGAAAFLTRERLGDFLGGDSLGSAVASVASGAVAGDPSAAEVAALVDRRGALRAFVVGVDSSGVASLVT